MPVDISTLTENLPTRKSDLNIAVPTNLWVGIINSVLSSAYSLPRKCNREPGEFGSLDADTRQTVGLSPLPYPAPFLRTSAVYGIEKGSCYPADDCVSTIITGWTLESWDAPDRLASVNHSATLAVTTLPSPCKAFREP